MENTPIDFSTLYRLIPDTPDKNPFYIGDTRKTVGVFTMFCTRKKMVPANIKEFTGYKDVSDLLPEGHLINYRQIWSISYDHFLDDAGDLHNRLILELTKDRNAFDIPIVRMIIEKPMNMILCPDSEIIQLSIDDYRVDGWEQGNFKIYNAEMDTDWEILCEAIIFERGTQKPNFIAN